MTMKRQPIKAKLHDAAKTLSTSDKNDLTSETSSTRLKTEKRQKDIDHYNFGTVFEKPAELDMIQVQGSDIIIRLFKENYIKNVNVLPGNNVLYDAWVSQVDGRTSRTAPAKWVDNPMPYIHSGVIVSISPAAKAEYVKKQKELMEIDPSIGRDFKVLEEGDIVQLRHFMIADHRFYVNQQERDFIKNPEEYRIVHFDGFVKLHPSYIDTIVVDNAAFLEQMSPFAQYQDWKKTQDEINERGGMTEEGLDETIVTE